MTRRVLEIESIAEFDAHIARTRRLNGWFVKSLDLTDRSADLRRVEPGGAVFLGCDFGPGVEAELRGAGALLFPRLPDLPFDPYRGNLYDADQLYGPGPYAVSPDAAIYAWSKRARDRTLTDELAATLHDHAITDALNEATDHRELRTLVGVMGGHALLRTDATYRAAVELGARLTEAGRTVLTGGGPGAMEAANLGAYLSPWPDALDEALLILAGAPAYKVGIDAWVRAAVDVRRCWPPGEAGRSLSIPTWFYGHEPTNPFATGIAKYFANALREDTLLHRCRGGIVYLPGQAGTVQEIFQAVTENFYAADPALVAPMVLVGTDYWTKTYPAWELLQRLGEGRALGEVIHCVDDVDSAVALLLANGPRLGPP
jgi:predicted Rossmann-fold nucleotide-binding protein